MKRKIIQELEHIEKKHAVRIISASESGSRAWGFPSNDSDYDVRFIYANKPDWYLTIGNKRDVIELPVDQILDINGWDLKKALQLLRKSNSPLMEWLSSPIKYRVLPHAYEKLSALSRLAFLPETSCHHYLSMARKSVEILNGDKKAKLKTYMYAIRPILCCKWIIQHLSQPPMHISDLLTELDVDKSFKDNVTELIDIKKRHSEKYRLERSEFLDSYIDNKIATLQEKIPKNPTGPGLELFDDVFRKIITELDF